MNASEMDEEVAYHEAGHAVIAWLLGLQLTNAEITWDIVDDIGADSYGRIQIDDGKHSNEAMFLVCVAGVVAERKQLGVEIKPSQSLFADSGRSDYAYAVKVLKESLGEKHKAAGFVEQYALPLVTFLVDHHWELISAFAEHLIQVRQMNSVEIDLFIRQHQIRDLSQLDFGPYFYDGK